MGASIDKWVFQVRIPTPATVPQPRQTCRDGSAESTVTRRNAVLLVNTRFCSKGLAHIQYNCGAKDIGE
jgi:hypothetical protein